MPVRHRKLASEGFQRNENIDESTNALVDRAEEKHRYRDGRRARDTYSETNVSDSFVRLWFRPMDPSNLAVFRIVFGVLMICDGIHERGLSYIMDKWGDTSVCRFPLFDFLRPMPVEWMCLLYLLMAAGALGITVGLFFRVSCAMFVLPYWYLFLLEKSAWNNHSYLFGLTATILLFSDANRFWSLDAWRSDILSNADIPAWNYHVIRFQLFVVYFIAGLKKLDRDWIDGYSMSQLSIQWVFDPFRLVLSNDQIDQYVVHWGGLVLDLSAGFLLSFDKTRTLGAALVTSFHFMNSRMFRIGQFPYVMLCTTALFFSPGWPKKVFPKKLIPSGTEEQRSAHCLYTGEKPRSYHVLVVILTMCFMSWQTFMPYSHFITKGYNNWSGGLYGYSWDMMVHNWDTQHIKIKYMSRSTGEEGFLDPEAFVFNGRWASHPDMVKQHALCIANHLETSFGVPHVAIYMDVWQSMNKRFHQRMYDPTVDLVAAPWSPFHSTPWMLPLLNDLTSWRSKLSQISTEAKHRDPDWFIDNPDVTFVADFPGMLLENHISEDLGKTNITLLVGEAVVQDAGSSTNYTLRHNQPYRVKQGTHKVYVTSDTAACYMYTYSNTTKVQQEQQLLQIEQRLAAGESQEEIEKQAQRNETLRILLELRDQKSQNVNVTASEKEKNFWQRNVVDGLTDTAKIVRSSFWMSYTAIESVITGQPMTEVLEKHLGAEELDEL